MVYVIDDCRLFDIFWLQTMTESTCKILKLDWKTQFFSSKILEILVLHLCTALKKQPSQL